MAGFRLSVLSDLYFASRPARRLRCHPDRCWSGTSRIISLVKMSELHHAPVRAAGRRRTNRCPYQSDHTELDGRRRAIGGEYRSVRSGHRLVGWRPPGRFVAAVGRVPAAAFRRNKRHELEEKFEVHYHVTGFSGSLVRYEGYRSRQINYFRIAMSSA